MNKIQGYLHGAATQGHAELCLQGLASFSNSHKGTIQASEPFSLPLSYKTVTGKHRVV